MGLRRGARRSSEVGDSPPSIRTSKGVEFGITEGDGDEAVVANELLAPLRGRQLVQFRMGSGLHLDFGSDYEVTIETRLIVESLGTSWSGEPLTAEAAGALLPLVTQPLSAAQIARDRALSLAIGDATLRVLPHPSYEAWQVRGPQGMLIVCSPGGDYVAVWRRQAQG